MTKYLRGKLHWWKANTGLGQPSIPRIVISFFLRSSSTSYYLCEKKKKSKDKHKMPAWT